MQTDFAPGVGHRLHLTGGWERCARRRVLEVEPPTPLSNTRNHSHLAVIRGAGVEKRHAECGGCLDSICFGSNH